MKMHTPSGAILSPEYVLRLMSVSVRFTSEKFSSCVSLFITDIANPVSSSIGYIFHLC